MGDDGFPTFLLYIGLGIFFLIVLSIFFETFTGASNFKVECKAERPFVLNREIYKCVKVNIQ